MIGLLTFGECHNLKTLELTDDIKELGWFCLWGTGVADLRIPQRVQRTREQLGLDQDPKVLRLPDGLEVVEDDWFSESDIERLIISNTVKKLGDHAFSSCVKLREVVFEPGSRLETIGSYCFAHCDIEQVTIPRSVRDIGNLAFSGCKNFRSLTFEDRSMLEHVGEDVLLRTPLAEDKGLFPSTEHADDDESTSFSEW